MKTLCKYLCMVTSICGRRWIQLILALKIVSKNPGDAWIHRMEKDTLMHILNTLLL